jgi:hypothetical protein
MSKRVVHRAFALQEGTKRRDRDFGNTGPFSSPQPCSRNNCVSTGSLPLLVAPSAERLHGAIWTRKGLAEHRGRLLSPKAPPKNSANRTKMPANNAATAAAVAVLLPFSTIVIQGDPFVLMWKKPTEDRLRARRVLEAQMVRRPRHRVERPRRGRPSYAQFRFDIEDKDDS